MNFISVEFALGFLLLFPLYWVLQPWPRTQNLLLTVVGLVLLWLYASGVAVAVLFFYTAAIRVCVHFSMISLSNRTRSFWLWLGVVGSIVHLGVWKYSELYRPAIAHMLTDHGVSTPVFDSSWLLPLGISYYTFQGISYLIGVHRREILGPKSLRLIDLLHHFGLFLTISSGPILRAINAKHLTDYSDKPCNALEQILSGKPRSIEAPMLAISLIIIGIGKKWWLASWLGQVAVDPVFSNPSLYQTVDVLAAIYGYTLQLFLDFSGYSDIVVGLGLLLGLRLPINFRTPLLAHNLREFWNRWHISLSTWIRDHIYLPLGGSRRGFALTQVNLAVAMVLSGIWHGYGLNFLFWGLAHGLILITLNVGDRLIAFFFPSPERTRDHLASLGLLGRAAGVFATVQFVCMAFVLFRTRTLAEARAIFQSLVENFHDIPLQAHSLPLLLSMTGLWVLYPKLARGPEGFANCLQRLPSLLRPVPVVLALLLIVLMAPPGIPGFIYANF